MIFRIKISMLEIDFENNADPCCIIHVMMFTIILDFISFINCRNPLM